MWGFSDFSIHIRSRLSFLFILLTYCRTLILLLFSLFHYITQFCWQKHFIPALLSSRKWHNYLNIIKSWKNEHENDRDLIVFFHSASHLPQLQRIEFSFCLYHILLLFTGCFFLYNSRSCFNSCWLRSDNGLLVARKKNFGYVDNEMNFLRSE